MIKIVNLCALIPSYNEGGTIGAIIRELVGRRMVVYVIDDGSTDNSADVAEREGAVVLRHKRNKGKGAALREGFRHVLKKNFDGVLVMDGDNQHQPDDIDAFLKAMEEMDADIVIGNRMFDTRLMPFIRICVNRFMSGLISKIAGQDVPDSQCGFRLIKTEVLRNIELESSNYEIESEFIIKAARRGFKISSVPIKTVYQNEKSKINPALDTLRFMALMVKLKFKNR